MQTEKLEFESFAPFLGEWADRFRPFIESQAMFDIYQTLKNEREVIVPSSDVTFRSFANCSPKNLKSIWFLMDPYPRRYKIQPGEKVGRNQATGIPMACENSPDGKLQPSLEVFYETMSKDLGKKVEQTPDLRYLLQQGVLLLNSDLTCKLNKTNSHDRLWEPFMKFFLEDVLAGFSGLVYVLSGNVSHRLEKYINPFSGHIYKIEHPAAASHTHKTWNNKDIFNVTNKILKLNNNEGILWDAKEYKETLEPPF